VGITSMVYGFKPCFIFDSLSMGRALRGVEVGNSLSKLAAAYGLPPKGRAVHSTDGVGPHISKHILAELVDYCINDVALCEAIFAKLLYRIDPDGTTLGQYPTAELRLIDMTVRMFTDAQLVLDTPMLNTALKADIVRLAELLERVEIDDETVLASNVQFAKVLERLGVPAPMKVSKTTGQPALALAKSDAMFQALLNGSNADVSALCEARLRVKSTLERTRAQRFIEIASRGALPVPLNYYAAMSGRWGGCLVAETQVLVYDPVRAVCSKKIVDVMPDDLVWDGVEFVAHEGVKFSGFQEVVTYAGITGTPTHEVFLAEGGSCGLADAALRGAKLLGAGEPSSGAVDAARSFYKRSGR